MTAVKVKATVWRTCVVLLLVCIGFLIWDPVYRFALWVSYQQLTNGLWGNGFSCIVELPASANADDVVQRYFKIKRAHASKVFELKRIWMLGAAEPYWAARVEEDGMMESLLVHFEPDTRPPSSAGKGHWLVRPY